jgi:hypothetical protein
MAATTITKLTCDSGHCGAVWMPGPNTGSLTASRARDFASRDGWTTIRRWGCSVHDYCPVCSEIRSAQIRRRATEAEEAAQ